MQYVILDLEWNTAYSNKIDGFINEIIEFGAVKLDENFNSVSSFSSFVKPKIEKKLRTRVKTLTNISNDDIADADSFPTVCDQFSEWIGDIENTIIMSWGDMDIRTLIDNCKYFFNDPTIPFVKKYVDLQSYFMKVKSLPKSQQIGLSNAAEMIDINPDDYVHHRALNDSELSAQCFRLVYEQNFEESIINCDDEFYKRIMFKPYYINDINDKFVDKSVLSCKCHECGKKANQITEWKFSKNSFNAFFYCNSCKMKYRVSIQFKKTYNQVNMKKNVIVC